VLFDKVQQKILKILVKLWTLENRLLKFEAIVQHKKEKKSVLLTLSADISQYVKDLQTLPTLEESAVHDSLGL